jgi:hypothetical protein
MGVSSTYCKDENTFGPEESSSQFEQWGNGGALQNRTPEK